MKARWESGARAVLPRVDGFGRIKNKNGGRHGDRLRSRGGKYRSSGVVLNPSATIDNIAFEKKNDSERGSFDTINMFCTPIVLYAFVGGTISNETFIVNISAKRPNIFFRFNGNEE